MLRPGRPPADLHAELVRARNQRIAWHDLVGAGGRPDGPNARYLDAAVATDLVVAPATADLLARLSGVAGPSAVYLHLDRLRAAGVEFLFHITAVVDLGGQQDCSVTDTTDARHAAALVDPDHHRLHLPLTLPP